MLQLNLGSGDCPIEGFDNLDAKTGDSIYPLDYDDGSVDVIRASHVLEHFSVREVPQVLKHWVQKLKVGGELLIAVPDFKVIAQDYLAGKQIPVQGYVMGGQVDGYDFHKTIFDDEALRDCLADAGLVDIQPWYSNLGDCASLPISLNLCGRKLSRGAELSPEIDIGDIARQTGAVMSVPRLGFMDNFFSAFQALVPLKIGLRKQSGAFWGQCLTRAIELTIAEGKRYILTVDYDTVFTRHDVEQLLALAVHYPDAHAVAAIQASRTRQFPLFTIRGDDGNNVAQLPIDDFNGPLVKATTAHFGLTLIRVDALEQIDKPWFLGVPDDANEWGDGRTDDDIHFWRQWERAGLNLYVAPRIVVGHLELMIRWPGRDMGPIHQHPSEFFESGKPSDAWT